MNLSERIKNHLPELGILFLLLIFLVYYGIFLPFFLALAVAFAVGRRLKKWLTFIKNWELRLSVFLILVLGALILFLSLSASFIAEDAQRFSKSFEVLIDENQNELDAGAQKVKEWTENLVDDQTIEGLLDEQLAGLDSITESGEMDWSKIGAQFEKLPDLFKSDQKEEAQFTLPSFGFWYQFGSFWLYLVLILYNFKYFDDVQQRYRNPDLETSWQLFWQDFNQSFLRYFRLRTRIVIILLPLYLAAFLLLDLPGTFIYILALFILLYIPYFHYLLLIPMALSSLVLSTEIALSYWWIVGILVAIFLLASLLEELLLIPKIMEENIGMNPVIMVLGLSFFTYVFGTLGILLGTPLTSLCIIYLKRFVLTKWFPNTRLSA